MPMREHAQLLRVLAERVYTAHLSTGKAVRDPSDFNEWLSGLAARAEAAGSLEKFLAELEGPS
jgi:hypothetical protein